MMGLTKEQAAFETISGQWAKQQGFTKVEFLEDPTSSVVKIIFYK